MIRSVILVVLSLAQSLQAASNTDIFSNELRCYTTAMDLLYPTETIETALDDSLLRDEKFQRLSTSEMIETRASHLRQALRGRTLLEENVVVTVDQHLFVFSKDGAYKGELPQKQTGAAYLLKLDRDQQQPIYIKLSRRFQSSSIALSDTPMGKSNTPMALKALSKPEHFYPLLVREINETLVQVRMKLRQGEIEDADYEKALRACIKVKDDELHEAILKTLHIITT
ncbi:hypothetical protein K2X33_06680 [bacterium]|nr:hypothetical protein [bacterium]